MSRKLEQLRESLRSDGVAAVRLKGHDWFAWATGGGDNSLYSFCETGVAELFITESRALMLTFETDRERLAIDHLPREYELLSFPWTQENAMMEFVQSEAKGRTVASDRPTDGETRLSDDWLGLKTRLSERELARYQDLGTDCARAATIALTRLHPEMRECDLAALAAEELYKKGVQPVLILAAGENRSSRYRHPVPTEARVGERAQLTLCGRRRGLHAALTRQVLFREPSEVERRNLFDAASLEAECFTAVEDLRPLPDIYRRLRGRYTSMGYALEADRFHFGGVTGYLPKEILARPLGAKGFKVDTQMAFNWNHAIGAVKMEDTVFLGADRRLTVLTFDPEWPMFHCNGRARPDLLVRS